MVMNLLASPSKNTWKFNSKPRTTSFKVQFDETHKWPFHQALFWNRLPGESIPGVIFSTIEKNHTIWNIPSARWFPKKSLSTATKVRCFNLRKGRRGWFNKKPPKPSMTTGTFTYMDGWFQKQGHGSHKTCLLVKVSRFRKISGVVT